MNKINTPVAAALLMSVIPANAVELPCPKFGVQLEQKATKNLPFVIQRLYPAARVKSDCARAMQIAAQGDEAAMDKMIEQDRITFFAVGTLVYPVKSSGYRSVFIGPNATHLPLFRLAVTDLRSFLLSQDIVYVGGGNTRNMLVLWHEWGLDVILREAWEKGTILCGISAGSICWFEEGLSDSVAAGELRPLTCLGFLQGSNCPHYDGEPLRRPRFQSFISEGLMVGGYAADDWVGLHFVGSKLHQVVSARANANAYEVSRISVGLQEKVIRPVLLRS